jgi:double-stranded uracil-DNA glycosylase
VAKRDVKTALICSFPPIAAPDARVLVLGTMPSIASLAKQQYYGHPQNSFWPIMGCLFGAGRDLPYGERQQILHERGVAVWDVLQECYREGSLDADIQIESESPNDFVTFFRRHPQVGSIFFNGQKSESLFRRHVLPTLAGLGRDFRYVRLPSTSPAHAGRSFEQKLSAWRAVERALRERKKTRRQGEGETRRHRC